mmetsp:Transcript_112718/g.313607  ORF Transcript_112718/g.313607 Transcript_112718/m.313607 type:complete len:244 (+) Transcript_112718:285-1016(+)
MLGRSTSHHPPQAGRPAPKVPAGLPRGKPHPAHVVVAAAEALAGLNAQDLEDKHPPHFQGEVLGLLVQEALQLCEDDVWLGVRAHLPHDELDHPLLLCPEVLGHFLLDPRAQLLLDDVVIVDALPIDLIRECLGLVCWDLLDKPTHLIIPQLHLARRWAIKPREWFVLPRLATRVKLLWLTEEGTNRRRASTAQHSTILTCGLVSTRMSHLLLHRLQQLGSCSLLLLLLLCFSFLSLLVAFPL